MQLHWGSSCSAHFVLECVIVSSAAMSAALGPLAVAAALMADERLVLAQAAVHTAQALIVLEATAASGSAVIMLQLKVAAEMAVAADPPMAAAAVAEMHSVTAFAVVTGAQTAD